MVSRLTATISGAAALVSASWVCTICTMLGKNIVNGLIESFDSRSCPLQRLSESWLLL